ncbi:hypothetical protein BDF20DRAFT_914687 [Mycotypha africana]|uniref:uncharacterized protein n=1 Tax=Mycotypha africana TaxID=64632 RepID=UPI0023015B4D|nr:uncharacterized protein BDF20DRAFT_914687 [Mycotypha africana]KAI8973205.1 hypothetical protein BDF20DRAFT_914687 [Mycotypha africana]
MKFTLVTVLAALASTVLAQGTSTTPTAAANAGVAVNLPSLGQVLNAGTTFKITWTVDSTTANPSNTIDSIALMKGGSANLETAIVNILSAPIPINPPSYDWNIPTNIETNPSYVLALRGNNGATTYSTYFTIMGAAAGTTNANATTSSSVSAAATSPTGTTTTATNAGSKANDSTNASASASAAPSPSNESAGSKTAQVTIAGVAGVAGILALML